MLKSNQNNPLISIIIINYNAGDYLINCVNSILKSNYLNYEILIVDNNSTDQSYLKCKKMNDRIKIFENKKNLGYCEGNNIGIKLAKGEFIIILNPDTIVEPNWINGLLKSYKDFGDGLYQPKILAFEDNLFESAGNMIQLFGYGFSKARGIKDIGQYDEPHEIGFASGACLFTKTEIIKKIGLFDPFIFLYLDDLDLGWRAQQLGIKSYYVPNITILHAGSYNYKWSAMKFFWLERNRHYCILTHISKSTILKMIPALILVEIMMIIFYSVKGYGKMKIKAYFQILKNIKQIRRKHIELNQKRVISDKEIMKKFSDEVFIPEQVSNELNIKIFNRILSILSKYTKKII